MRFTFETLEKLLFQRKVLLFFFLVFTEQRRATAGPIWPAKATGKGEGGARGQQQPRPHAWVAAAQPKE